ncbi:MAG: glycosyltransferase family 92 protein [Cyanobacteria bacterium SZAS-4]|nr:glycosyltransferase family 92 protein [Cyanobacteria bacterium SZAS-4]
MRTAIESVLAQTFDDFELLISDDRSDDSSCDIIKEYASRDRRINWWINEKRLGLFANYNRCIEKSRGEFIKPFAQDDVCKKELIAELVALMHEHPEISLAASRRLEIDEFGDEITVNRAAELVDYLGYKRVYQGEEVISACLDYTLINLVGEPCAVMFKNSETGEGFSTTYRHVGDIEYWLRILESGDFGLIEKPLVSFRKHKGSTSTVNITQLWYLTDLVHIAHQFSHRLGRGKSTPEEFIKRNFAGASQEVPQLIGGTFDISVIRAVDEYSQEDVFALKKSFFICLSMLAELLTAKENTYTYHFDPEVALNEQHIASLEHEVRSMLGSISWKATKWLREANRFLTSSQLTQLDEPQTLIADSPTEKQRLYLEYLKRKREKILGSRSWRLTSKLRRDFASSEVFEERSFQILADVSTKKELAKSLTVHTTSNASSSISSESSVQSWMGNIGRLHKFDIDCARPYDLIMAVHECSLTGAPKLALSLVKTYASMGIKCLVVARAGGKLMRDFRSACDVLDLSTNPDFAVGLKTWMDKLVEAGSVRPNTAAFVNTAELIEICELLHGYSCKVISLIHEFLSDYSRLAQTNLARFSEAIVFSANSTLEDAIKGCELKGNTIKISQPLLNSHFSSLEKEEGKGFLLRRHGIEKDSFVVLSCGTADPRKGIDYFTQVAIELFSRFERGKPSLHFIWIGGESPINKSSFAWAIKDIKRAGLEKHVHFVGEQEKTESFYAGADIFLLPSRQDPMPLVAQMAQAAALPVIAFAGSGGAEEIVMDGGGKLVAFGNVSQMTETVLRYFKDRELLHKDSQAARKNRCVTRKFEDYARQLLEISGWNVGQSNGIIRDIECEVPLPPEELRYLVAGSADIPGFLNGGRETATAIVQLLNKNGIDLSGLEHILDFGCGCGRVLRHMCKLTPARVDGTDYNPRYMKWLGEAFLSQSFSVNHLSPPSEYESDRFDLIYAISVFTHLTQEQQTAWMNEFARILKPKGYLVFTTHGDHEVYDAAMTKEELAAYRANHFYVSQAASSGKNECFSRQTSLHVGQVLCQNFELLDFEEYGAKGTGNQDLYLTRSKKSNRCPLEAGSIKKDGKLAIKTQDGIKWQNTLAITTMFQNEARFLEEWIEYHRLVGVEKFILFNNLSSDNYETVLHDYVKHGIVDLIEWPYESHTLNQYVPIQCRAFKQAITRSVGKVKWLSMQDTDEFIVPLDGEDIISIIDEFSDRGGFVVPYRFFGTSFVKKITDHALLIESLTLSAPTESLRNSRFKSIVRPERVRSIESPHFAYYNDGYYHVDERGEQVEDPEIFIPSSRIRLNHYWSRDEEFFHTQKNANVLQWGVSVTEVENTMKELNSVKDDAILKFTTPLRERLSHKKDNFN